MGNKFNEAISLIRDKWDDNKFINNEEYDRRLEDVKLFKKKKTTCKRDYRTIRKNDVILFNGKERLIRAMDHDNDGIYIITLKTKYYSIFSDLHIWQSVTVRWLKLN